MKFLWEWGWQWLYHWNGNRSGIKVWNGNRAMGMEINSHCSFSQYHMRICSVIRELAKPSHFIFTLARPSPEHAINSYRTLDVLWTEWLCVLILTKIIHCFFSVHYYKTFWNSSCFNGNGNGRKWELLFRNKWELDYSRTTAAHYWRELLLPPGECVCNAHISPSLFNLEMCGNDFVYPFPWLHSHSQPWEILDYSPIPIYSWKVIPVPSHSHSQRWPPRLHPNRAGWYSIYRPHKA